MKISGSVAVVTGAGSGIGRSIAVALNSAGASVVGPTGKPFTQASIGMALAMRDLMTDLRATGDVKGYNPAFTRKDRSRFLEAMEMAVQAILRRG